MIKKNGFISISIIYSFFLIFMLFLFLIMSSFINTRIRLNILKKDIKESNAGPDKYLIDLILNAPSSDVIKKQGDAFRFTGDDPDNYIYYNGELWRVVGAFCNNSSSCNERNYSDWNIKIIRTTPIKLGWDCKKSGIGSSTSDKGSNDWTDSQLMMLLNSSNVYQENPQHHSNYEIDVCTIKDSNGVTIYPYMGAYMDKHLPLYKPYATGAEGFDIRNAVAINTCGSSSDNNCLIPISTNDIGKMAANIWNVKKIDFSSVSSTTNGIYALEKSTTNAEKWKAYVGLLYASDFCYASTTNVENCLKNNSVPNSWLKTSNNEWVIDATTDNKVIYVKDKFYSSDDICSEKLVRPTVFLKYSVKLIGNYNGSQTSPYHIGE